MNATDTTYIKRSRAIERIAQICFFQATKDYMALRSACFEPDADMQSFMRAKAAVAEDGLNKMKNGALEQIMNKPFFRFSRFDKYIIIG